MQLSLARPTAGLLSILWVLAPISLAPASAQSVSQPSNPQGQAAPAPKPQNTVVPPGQTWTDGAGATVTNSANSTGNAIIYPDPRVPGFYIIELLPGFDGELSGLIGGDRVVGEENIKADIEIHGGQVTLEPSSSVKVTNPDVVGNGSGPSTTVITPMGSTTVAPGNSQTFNT